MTKAPSSRQSGQRNKDPCALAARDKQGVHSAAGQQSMPSPASPQTRHGVIVMVRGPGALCGEISLRRRLMLSLATWSGGLMRRRSADGQQSGSTRAPRGSTLGSAGQRFGSGAHLERLGISGFAGCRLTPATAHASTELARPHTTSLTNRRRGAPRLGIPVVRPVHAIHAAQTTANSLEDSFVAYNSARSSAAHRCASAGRTTLSNPKAN